MKRLLVYLFIFQLVSLGLTAQVHALDATHSAGETLHVHIAIHDHNSFDHDSYDHDFSDHHTPGHHSAEQFSSDLSPADDYQGQVTQVDMENSAGDGSSSHDEQGHAHLPIVESLPSESAIHRLASQTWQSPSNFSCLKKAFRPPVPPPDTSELS